MPNCLGVYVEKNLIKYAKVSRDKTSANFTIEGYGVKFYENLEETVKAIIAETNSTADDLCMNISRENYIEFNVFSKLRTKEIKELLNTEFQTYCAEKGVPASVWEMRYTLVKNTSNTDSYKAICVTANKAELSNLWQMFEMQKLTSLSAMPFTITNILKDKGLGEQVAIVNIEDETSVTVITKGEISKVATISIGMEEILSNLAGKFNSYAKAYEACKGVTITFDDSYNFTEDQKQVMELLLPSMYDLRERVKRAIAEYGSEIRKIYLTGTGVIINNIDLYFAEVFDAQTCEILKPFFVGREESDVKDKIEVNSAIALAMNGLGLNEKALDFCTAGQSFLGGDVIKKRWKELISKETLEKVKEKLLSVKKVQKNLNVEEDGIAIKPNIEFDENVGSGEIINAEPETEYVSVGLDSFDKWFIRLAVSLGLAFFTYAGLSYYTNNVIEAKTNEATRNIQEANAQIEKVEADISFVATKATEYKSKTDKLAKILEEIKITSTRSYDVPNFMSQLMFIIPEDVKVTSVIITTDNHVTIEAQSGKYAQLGYFVSRLKLENALKDVDMQVLEMNSDIKIKINGELP